MSSRPLRVVPADAPLGAEVRGVDIAAGLAAESLSRIKEAWDRHLVLVLRDQSPDDDALVAFARSLGPLDPPGPNPYGRPFHRRHPELNVISNIVEDGQPIGNLGYGEAVWHADMTYVERPPMGAVLMAMEVPAQGGDTWFADMFAAHDALPDDLREAAQGRVAIHDASHNSAGMLRKGYVEVDDVRDTPGARHPLVRTEPETGRRCLFLGRRPRSYVVGLEVADSDRLLDRLWAHATRPDLVFVHRWRPGDVLMWKNLCVLHRRDAFDSQARRRLHRAQIRGEEVIA
ncbi:MAG: TauD/TfdA family dioxygenase [Ectothiorhodospiraceae bacterium]|nr:TauD/TfdA family dioxygenase [Ectothiorhodospiraceae bacterium]